MNWRGFCNRVNCLIPRFLLDLEQGRDPSTINTDFLELISRALESSGTYRKAQPLWWNPECEESVARRRDALKSYIADQTREKRVTCRREALGRCRSKGEWNQNAPKDTEGHDVDPR